MWDSYVIGSSLYHTTDSDYDVAIYSAGSYCSCSWPHALLLIFINKVYWLDNTSYTSYMYEPISLVVMDQVSTMLSIGKLHTRFQIACACVCVCMCVRVCVCAGAIIFTLKVV